MYGALERLGGGSSFDDFRLWEIAENLHRCELTVLERSEHIAEWVRLTEEKQAAVSAQLAPKLSARGRSGEGRPESGINAAVRELGVERTQALAARPPGRWSEKCGTRVDVWAKESWRTNGPISAATVNLVQSRNQARSV